MIPVRFLPSFWLPKDADRGPEVFFKVSTKIRLLILREVGDLACLFGDSVDLAKCHL